MMDIIENVAWMLSCGAVGMIIGILTERIILPRLGKFTKKTSTHLDDIIFASLKNLVTFWLILGGLSIGLNTFGKEFHGINALNKICLSLLVISFSILVIRVFTQLIRYRTTDPGGKSPSTSIILNISRITIFLIGGMIILQVFGISIAPILTALGVGGLAVALALQETLSNLFSGIQLIASKNLRNGDYIKLSTGETGYVTDITWRNTVIRELSNNMIVVPNSKLSSAIITNYNLPEPELSVLVDVSVSYDSDLEKVEKITSDTAKKVLEATTGSIKEFDPFIRYHTFDDSGINFTVILRGGMFENNFLIKHEFIKALHKAYNENAINIPFPHRTVIMKKE